MTRARRWILFALAIGSLLVMTYGGVLLAFSVPLDERMLAANPDLAPAGRAIVAPIADPSQVATHAEGGPAALLVTGHANGTFPASATDKELARALAYVNGSGEPTNLTLTDVPSREGASNMTIDVAALSGGTRGWIVMGSGESEPRFVDAESVLGAVVRFTSGAELVLLFGGGFLGFIAPLVAIVVTHKPAGRAGAPVALCRECRGAIPANAEFCLRCGAYQPEATKDA